MWQISWYLSKTGAPTARVACWKKKSLPGNSELASNPATNLPEPSPSLPFPNSPRRFQEPSLQLTQNLPSPEPELGTSATSTLKP